MTRRAQLVALAAAVVAVALVPVLAAYLQLGYQPAVGDRERPLAEANQTLDRALRRATAGVPRTFDWGARANASRAVRERLAPALAALGTAAPPGHVRNLTYDRAAARRVAANRCPSGPDRQFGPCRAVDGVVVQRRSNRTHVVAVAVRVRVASAEGTTAATLVVWR